MTNGEFIDNMTMDEILSHPQFYSLHITKGIEGNPDYWKVTFESNQRSESGRAWLSLNGSEIYNKLFCYYKLKQ